jgi:YggT family protein
METGLILLLNALLYFIKFYFFLLVLRVTLYWYPNISMYNEPFYSLQRLTNPYLNIFRSVLPVAFGMDFSALLGFLILQVLIEVIPRIISFI